jgi:DNA-binding NarL/FixJ family response regulator
MLSYQMKTMQAGGASGAARVSDLVPARGRALKVALPPSEARHAAAKIRILIAEPHPIFRYGLRTLLDAEHDFSVVGEAADGTQALHLVGELQPDILLLDLSKPRLSGFEVLHELRRGDVTVKRMVLVDEIDKSERMKILQLGGHAIVPKETPPPLLLKSVRTVAAGGYWVGRETVSDLVEALSRLENGDGALAPRNWRLTPRELEMLALVVGGSTNGDMAKQCSVSEDTVKHHLTSIFNKTGVSNRLELALFAIHHRLVGNPPS